METHARAAARSMYAMFAMCVNRLLTILRANCLLHMEDETYTCVVLYVTLVAPVGKNNERKIFGMAANARLVKQDIRVPSVR